MLNENETQRYAKHLSLLEIGQPGQAKLKQAKVLIIGAGGLGCPVSQLLVASGIGTVGIVDGDVVHISNLQRQILFNDLDLKKNKANVLQQKLSILNPNTVVNAYPYFITKENASDLISGYDIIVDCTDQIDAKKLLGAETAKQEKVLVYGAIHKYEGQVSTLNLTKNNSYETLFPPNPKNELLLSCSDIGVYAILPSLIGGFQVNEVLKVILNLGDTLDGKVMFYNARTNYLSVIKFEEN
jgi:molybdopterin/thiamine biosynthesis adenylyltransferase